MTKEQVRIQKKLTALNQIRKLYDPHIHNQFEFYGEPIHIQREEKIHMIIVQLENELKEK